MISTTRKLILGGLCAAWALSITAEPTRKLAEACPRLHIPGTETQPGADDEPIVIDDAMVRLYADIGHFAAIGPTDQTGDSVSAVPDAVNKKAKPSKTRDRWRADYRRAVEAIRKSALRLAVLREELKDLEEQYFRAGSEAKRIRIEPRINRQQLEIENLEYSLQKQRSSFSHLVRQARQDGAQPGWFRDLPRP